MQQYEGDKFKVIRNLPDDLLNLENLEIKFLIKVDEETAINKKCEVADNKYFATLEEQDTIGLDGIYTYEFRLNNVSPRVLEQGSIKFENSIIVDNNFVPNTIKYIDISKFSERLKAVEESTGVVDMSIYAKTTDLDTKVDKVEGKNLSTNDFDETYKEKLDSLENYDDTDVKEAIQENKKTIEGISVIQGEKGEKGEKGDTGQDGVDGVDGRDGLSAYQLACENGFVGSIDEWLLSLKGESGNDGLQGEKGLDGNDGADGIDGKSAYNLALENGFTGSLEDWLLSLKGQDGTNGVDGSDGADGQDGLSAYQIAVNNGFSGSESQWIASLKGQKGKDGERGPRGYQGLKGKKGDRGPRGYQGPQGPPGPAGGGSGFPTQTLEHYLYPSHDWMTRTGAGPDQMVSLVPMMDFPSAGTLPFEREGGSDIWRITESGMSIQFVFVFENYPNNTYFFIRNINKDLDYPICTIQNMDRNNNQTIQAGMVAHSQLVQMDTNERFVILMKNLGGNPIPGNVRVVKEIQVHKFITGM